MEFRSDPAPALTRGLKLLELLCRDGHSSLEQLAAATGWPKSSVLRCLRAMEGCGVVAQPAGGKRWEALQKLVSIAGNAEREVSGLRRRLPELAERTGHCAELYSVAEGEVVLWDRAEPERAEVRAVARIGFRRNLHELEAVARIYFTAFDGEMRGFRFWRWQQGIRLPLLRTQARILLTKVRREGVAVDEDFNDNSIRRFAVAVQGTDSPLGWILAVAQVRTLRAAAEEAEIRRLLPHYCTQTQNPDLT